MEKIKNIEFSCELTQREFEKISDVLYDLGFDCEPVYCVSDVERKIIEFSLDFIETGPFFTDEDIRRDVEQLWKDLREKKNIKF